MYGTGRKRFRAAMTAAASVLVGALLLATTSDGGSLTPSPTTAPTATAPTASPSSAPSVTATDTPTDTPTVNPTAATSQPEQPERPQPAVSAPPGAPAAPAAVPPAPCVDPLRGRQGFELPDPDRTALLIGDSQSGGAAGVPADRTWTHAGLRSAGYDVRFVGAGGTGFVAANAAGAASYPTALAQGQWVLPCSDPALIVVQGGGNDAAQGATDAQITGGAGAVVDSLSRAYPSSTIVLIGTLARGAADGGGRRTAVDGVLRAFAVTRHLAFISPGDWLTRYQAGTQLADRVHLTQAGHDRLAVVLGTELDALQLTQPALDRAHQPRRFVVP
ncbi:SGNH/GDSL hydrolase family protein [Arthrobacter sp. Soc17.1.1.1]|uniref:SGNH/GDSL hydrolase family protein n=1 Tax=Arthrobacter sp. Soc17.1.1.1 TaxID=3121277 RepID=UPI002FE4C704